MDTDVLIIGAGGAGTRAAIEAQEKEVRVILVTKGKLPSGCSSVAMGAFQVAFGANDSPEVHFKDSIMGGLYLNDQKLVRLLANEAAQRTQDLEHYGTQILREEGKYKLFPFSGSTYPRGVLTSDPYVGGFMRGIVEEVKRKEIEIFENVLITKLLTQNGAVVGAAGIDLQRKAFMVFKSKSTVLATGGAGQLYALTTNPPDVTGDGYALAYQVGAELMDMEFIQFRACIVYPEALRGTPPPSDGLVTIGGRFYNAFGERYMKKYDPTNAERVTRDLMMIYTHKEIKAGRGTERGSVYNDLSGVSEEELNRFEKFLSKCEAEGIDPHWQPIEWAPGTHFFNGGVRINEKCETNIIGLYAAGEVTAGLHGANRLAGNALTETQVFGARAGKFAAERALSLSSPKIEKDQIDEEWNRITTILERKDGESVSNVKREIRTIMRNYVGVIRNEEELKMAIHKLEELRNEKLSKLCLTGKNNYGELQEALEVKNFVDLGEIIAKSALMRQESRGAHCREDYPKRNDEHWLKNITIHLQKGRMILKAIQPIMTEERPGL
ncbi:MAG: FAD-dependent oxidoreductase [Candidatus Hodarchaeota archaeon]